MKGEKGELDRMRERRTFFMVVSVLRLRRIAGAEHEIRAVAAMKYAALLDPTRKTQPSAASHVQRRDPSHSEAAPPRAGGRAPPEPYSSLDRRGLRKLLIRVV